MIYKERRKLGLIVLHVNNITMSWSIGMSRCAILNLFWLLADSLLLRILGDALEIYSL